jgi:hypothetical protein
MATSWYTGTLTSTSNGSEILTQIRNMLSAAGWTQSGNLFTRTVGARTSTVNLNSTSFTTTQYHMVTLNGVNFYLWTGTTTLVNAPFSVEISVDSDLFYVAIRGPRAFEVGTEDLTYGSTKSFALLTTIVPYLSVDASEDAQQVVLGSYTSPSRTTFTNKVYSKVGLNAAGNASGELATMRPAVQDVAVGDQLNNNAVAGNIMYWPYVLIEDVSGVRGMLKGVYFGGENYALTGDSSKLYENLNVRVEGLRYMTTVPFYAPNANPSIVGYSPLGTPTANVQQASTDSGGFSGGPIIIVKKGNGVE